MSSWWAGGEEGGGALTEWAKLIILILLSILWDSIHFEIDEKIHAVANRDGGVENLEIKGSLLVHVAEADSSRFRLALGPTSALVEDPEVQFKVGDDMLYPEWIASYEIL